jgi:N-acetylglucosamine-6-phosphate deacetylase
MLLKNIKIINHDHIIENADILIENGLIKTITTKAGKSSQVVVPGFIDSHIHGFNGYDVMDSPEALRIISKALSKFGVTSFLPTIMTNSLDNLNIALSNIAITKVEGAKILGIHMEGPFFGLARKGAQNPKYLIKGNVEILKQFIKSSQNFIKKISFDPLVCDLDLIKLMVQNNIVPIVGHSDATLEETNLALKAGATSCTHL